MVYPKRYSIYLRGTIARGLSFSIFSLEGLASNLAEGLSFSESLCNVWVWVWLHVFPI